MLTAKDIMTREVISVSPHLEVDKLATLLWEKRIGGVPVINDAGNLLGVVTESDLIDQTKKLHIPTVVTILDSLIFLESPAKMDEEMKKMTGTRVADICTGDIVSVSEDTSVEEIATIMSDKKIHTLPVVTNDQVVGVVGKADIIRTLASND